MSFSGRVMLLVTKKFAQKVYFNSNIRDKLFGTPTAAEFLSFYFTGLNILKTPL